MDVKIAFVTGYIGESPTNIPKISKSVDSYFITNNINIATNVNEKNVFTKVITLNDIPIIDSNKSVPNYITNSMNSKMLKVFPQTFLSKEYDFVVWYDNKFNVNVDDTINVINSWNKKHSLMLHLHPRKNVHNVRDEFNESMRRQKRYIYEKKQYTEYINDCKELGLVDDYKLHSQTGFIIYNLNHPMTKILQEGWMQEIKKCGIQCQISFNLFRQNYEEYIGEYTFPIGKWT